MILSRPFLFLICVATLATACSNQNGTPTAPSSAVAPESVAGSAIPADSSAISTIPDSAALQTAVAPLSAAELGIKPVPFRDIVEIVKRSQGQVVFFHLYASWCGPCRQEFPELIDFAKRHRAQGLKIVAVSLDEQRSDLEVFLKPHTLVFPAYLMTGSSEQEMGEGLRQLGASYEGGIPFTAVYDRQGKLVTQWTGSRDMAWFERVAQPLL